MTSVGTLFRRRFARPILMPQALTSLSRSSSEGEAVAGLSVENDIRKLRTRESIRKRLY